MSSTRRAILLAGLFAARIAGGGEIHDAAARGDIATLTRLASAGPAARASTDKDGLTALHLAVIRRQPEAVATLLKLGAPVEARDREGLTPLHHLAHSVEESVLENFRRSGGGRFGDALAELTKSGQSVTPGALLSLLRADLAGDDDPLRLLRNFTAASTPAQMDDELRCARALLAANANVYALDRERSTPLHHVAMSPRPDLARALVEAGAKVNAQNSTGLTPLHNAALFASPETVEYLLQQGAEPEGRSILIGVPPLLMAVTRGHARVVSKLLDFKADVNALGPDGGTALARASVLGATEVAQVLLDRGARVKVRFARVNHTPLHVAAARGFLPLVKLLLDAGAEPDARDSNGFTPLLDAAEQGRTLVVRALLLAGAKVNNTNTTGRTALWLAASRGHEETVTYLIKRDADPALAGADGQAPLHIAGYNAQPASLRALLAGKPSLNHLNRIGTPLHAVAAGPMLRAIANSQARGKTPPKAPTPPADSAACAKLLLDAGAPLDALESNGMTPVQTAAAFGNKAVLEVFATAAPASLTARDTQGLTALHHAARGPLIPGYTPEAQPALPAETLAGCGEVVTLLLERGAKTSVKDQLGLAPLHHAAGTGNVPAVKALLAAKADLRATDNAGSTALHWAAARGRGEIATLLLKAHAGRDVTDGEGQTPLHMAVAAGHLEVARVLLDSGAEPNLVNRRGQNALAYADAYNRPEIAKVLRQYGAKTQFVPHSPD